MGRSSRTKTKGKRSEEGQYIPLPYAQIKSPAWRSLSGAAVKVWLELHTRYNGGNNGKLHLSMKEAAEILGIGRATVKRAFDELEAKGFLVLEIPGDWYCRRAHDWRLTTKPMQGSKGKVAATLDWRGWQPPKKQTQGSGSEPSHGRMVPYQNQIRGFGSVSDTVTPSFRHSLGSDAEH
jgi:biotin operon repressor